VQPRRRPKSSGGIPCPPGLGEWVNDLAKEFNASQNKYKVTPIYKGSYDESMTAAIAAYRAGNAPHILQVFEVGTAMMMASGKAIKPVGEVMKPKPDRNSIRVCLYSRSRRLLHRPERADAELPVQQLDDGVLLQQGPHSRPPASIPSKPPKTWIEVTQAAAKLKASGHTCPLTIELAELDATGKLLGLA
jgi:sn-glycerol 3-phosphate transport system substrate-binding protein